MGNEDLRGVIVGSLCKIWEVFMDYRGLGLYGAPHPRESLGVICISSL